MDFIDRFFKEHVKKNYFTRHSQNEFYVLIDGIVILLQMALHIWLPQYSYVFDNGWTLQDETKCKWFILRSLKDNQVVNNKSSWMNTIKTLQPWKYQLVCVWCDILIIWFTKICKVSEKTCCAKQTVLI